MPDTVALQTSEWTGPVGSAWAEQWRRTDRSFGPLTDCLLEPGAIGRFAHALDIGCGAGELVQRLAASHPSAQILGIDISAELLDVARARCAQLGNARVEETDAATWHAQADAQPDLLISRHGVMFFADPVAAFSHLRQQSAPGAQLRFSCFRARSENEWVTALMSVLPPQPPADPTAPGPFAFGDRSRVQSILAAAGWHQIEFEALDYGMVVGEGEDALDGGLAYLQRIGPAARAMAELPERESAAAIERLRAMLARHQKNGVVSLPAAAWIVTARAPRL
jgi:SAM-dependent methyltransferase